MIQQRMIAALVPLSLFGLAFVLLSPPGWVGALRSSLAKQPALVVIDEAVSVDPSDLKSVVWLPRQTFKARLLKKVGQVLWVRPAGAPPADLEGFEPSGCREAHGVQLCAVSASSPSRWRLSDRLKGLAAAGSKKCVSTGSNSRCAYGDEGWEYVAREEHAFAGLKEPCIWTHPMKGRPVTISVPKLAPGQYRLRAGITDEGMRDGLPPVTLRIEGFGKKPLTMTAGEARGMKQLALPALSKPASVSIEISAPRTGARFLCWELLKTR